MLSAFGRFLFFIPAKIFVRNTTNEIPRIADSLGMISTFHYEKDIEVETKTLQPRT